MVKPNMALQKKFENLYTQCSTELIERHVILETIILALIAGVHHCVIGPPGVAKTMGVDNVMLHIDGLGPNDYFKAQLNKHTDPAELFGPWDLLLLQEGKYVHLTALTLEVAKVGFLDEMWKGATSLLNTMLMLVNEGDFKNGGVFTKVPLRTLFAASNELPTDTDLAPMYDRMLFRLVTDRIQEQANFIAMLKLPPPNPVKILSWDDVIAAGEAAEKIEIPDEVYVAMNTLRNDLAAQGIVPSDRRFKHSIKVIKAGAWLRGDTHAELVDMHTLSHILWDDPEDAQQVQDICLKLVSPLDQEANKLLNDIQTLSQSYSNVQAAREDGSMTKSDAHAKGVEIYGKAKKANEKLVKLAEECQSRNRNSVRVDQAIDSLERLVMVLMKEIFFMKEPPPGMNIGSGSGMNMPNL